MGAKVSAPSGGNPYPANAEMNVTPFVDVMLVLLIIFMIAAPLSTVSVPVELPPASSKPTEEKPPKPVFVSIEKDGKVYVGDENVTMAALPDKLRSKMENSTDERVYLRADQTLTYRQVMDVMNLLQDSGFYRVGLVAEEIADVAEAARP
jgi:TonB system transport protein ExbD (group 1)